MISLTKHIAIFLLIAPTFCLAQQLIIREPVKLLSLGDSYTIGQGVSSQEAWPWQLVTELRSSGVEANDPRIIATTGWRTDQLLSAIEKSNISQQFNLVSLLIGVNNYYQQQSIETYAKEFDQLLNTALELAGMNASSVFVLSIPDYGYTPFGQSKQQTISAGIDAFNQVNRTLTKAKGISYINITESSRKGLQQPNLVAADGLHPSGKMYAQWVEQILSKASIIRETTGPDVVATQEDPSLGLMIFPNPCKDFLTIETNQIIESIQMFSPSGFLISSFDKSESTLDISQLPAGLYLLKITTSTSIVHWRFTKASR